jgi:hypothetical protein
MAAPFKKTARRLKVGGLETLGELRVNCRKIAQDVRGPAAP